MQRCLGTLPLPYQVAPQPLVEARAPTPPRMGSSKSDDSTAVSLECTNGNKSSRTENIDADTDTYAVPTTVVPEKKIGPTNNESYFVQATEASKRREPEPFVEVKESVGLETLDNLPAAASASKEKRFRIQNGVCCLDAPYGDGTEPEVFDDLPTSKLSDRFMVLKLTGSSERFRYDKLLCSWTKEKHPADHSQGELRRPLHMPYGDGTELDAFVDLPVDESKERWREKQPRTTRQTMIPRLHLISCSRPSVPSPPVPHPRPARLSTPLFQAPRSLATVIDCVPQFARDTAASRNRRAANTVNVDEPWESHSSNEKIITCTNCGNQLVIRKSKLPAPGWEVCPEKIVAEGKIKLKLRVPCTLTIRDGKPARACCLRTAAGVQ